MKELNLIQTQLNAPKNQYNSFGKYKYRSCEDILAAVKPLLKETECTLILSDDIVAMDNRFYIKSTATICNKTGEKESAVGFAREEETKKGMDASQITGATSSYARKYALNGLFAIDDTRDADTLNVTKEYTQAPKPKSKATAAESAPQDTELHDLFESVKAYIAGAPNTEYLRNEIWAKYEALHGYKPFRDMITARKAELKQ